MDHPTMDLLAEVTRAARDTAERAASITMDALTRPAGRRLDGHAVTMLAEALRTRARHLDDALAAWEAGR